jgi:septum formation protein
MSLWRKTDRPIVLASQSPRRQELLAAMGIRFTVTVPTVASEEAFFGNGPIEPAAAKLAAAKAASVSQAHPEALVLGGDTVVVIDDRVLGKPAGIDTARSMLQSLSGRRHTVISGVALTCAAAGFSQCTSSKTNVYFRNLDEEEIEEYLRDKDYADKAGAYAIQGKAMTFVDRIEGCFYNVVGLPVAATIGLFTAYINRKDANNV